MVDNKFIYIDEQWHSILGEVISVIEPYHHVKLSKIIEPPRLSASKRHGSIVAVLPYIRQKVKMWGAGILKAENIKTLIEDGDDFDDFDGDFDDVDEDSDLMDEEEDDSLLKKNRLSRFDCV